MKLSNKRRICSAVCRDYKEIVPQRFLIKLIVNFCLVVPHMLVWNTHPLHLLHKEKIFVRGEGIYFPVKFINRILFYLKIKSAYQRGYKAPISLPEKR